MPNPNPIGEVDFFHETNGEKVDRLSGKTPSDKMNAARKADVRAAKDKEFRAKLYAYIAVNSISLPIAIVGMVTVGWYHYAGTHNSLSTSGNVIATAEDWAIAVNGLRILVEYCDRSDNQCAVSHDDFRYFGTGTNNDGFEWPEGAWTDAAIKAHTGSTYLYAAVGCYLGFNLCATICMSMAFCNRDTRYRMIGGTIAAAFGVASLVLGVLQFMMSLADFIALLETDNYVAKNHAPTLKESYSTYLMFILVGCQLVCAIVMFLLIKPKEECPDYLAEQLEKHRTVRGNRTKKYFDDRDATTCITEKSPVDTFQSGGHKAVGWTQGVHSEQLNVMYTEDHCVNHPIQILSPPRLEPIKKPSKDCSTVVELLEPPVSPSGFSTELCLNITPPELPGAVACAQAISGLSKSKSLAKLCVATKQRVRNVTRVPKQEKRGEKKKEMAVTISQDVHQTPNEKKT